MPVRSGAGFKKIFDLPVRPHPDFQSISQSGPGFNPVRVQSGSKNPAGSGPARIFLASLIPSLSIHQHSTHKIRCQLMLLYRENNQMKVVFFTDFATITSSSVTVIKCNNRIFKFNQQISLETLLNGLNKSSVDNQSLNKISQEGFLKLAI